MRISKTLLITLFLLFLHSTDLKAEDIKPMAPAFDMLMQKIDNTDTMPETAPCKPDKKQLKAKKNVDKDKNISPDNEQKVDKKIAKKDKKAENNKKEKNIAQKDKKNKKQPKENVASFNVSDDISVNADNNLNNDNTDHNNLQNSHNTEQSEEVKEFLDFNDSSTTINQPENQGTSSDNMLTSVQKNQHENLVKESGLLEVEENAIDKINKTIDAGEKEYFGSIPEMDPMAQKRLHSHNTGIRKEAELLEFEMRLEDPKVLKDLRILWSAAIEKSTTIRLAIQKLSNPDQAEKMDSGMMSKLLSPLASLAPMAMMASSSATQTASALIGGNMLGTLASDVDNQYNKAFIKVSDYDLIMLAKEVDELQAKLVVLYYEYSQASERLIASETALKNAEDLYREAQKTNNFASNTAADAFYREAQQNHLNAKHNYLSSRTSLEQLTGNDAIVYIERNDNSGEEETNNPEKVSEIVQPETSATGDQPLEAETVPQNPTPSLIDPF